METPRFSFSQFWDFPDFCGDVTFFSGIFPICPSRLSETTQARNIPERVCDTIGTFPEERWKPPKGSFYGGCFRKGVRVPIGVPGGGVQGGFLVGKEGEGEWVPGGEGWGGGVGIGIGTGK